MRLGLIDEVALDNRQKRLQIELCQQVPPEAKYIVEFDVDYVFILRSATPLLTKLGLLTEPELLKLFNLLLRMTDDPSDHSEPWKILEILRKLDAKGLLTVENYRTILKHSHDGILNRALQFFLTQESIINQTNFNLVIANRAKVMDLLVAFKLTLKVDSIIDLNLDKNKINDALFQTIITNPESIIDEHDEKTIMQCLDPWETKQLISGLRVITTPLTCILLGKVFAGLIIVDTTYIIDYDLAMYYLEEIPENNRWRELANQVLLHILIMLGDNTPDGRLARFELAEKAGKAGENICGLWRLIMKERK